MEWFDFVGVESVSSPALLLFPERIEANLRAMLAIAGGPERLRPHVKTHKLGPLVARQVELGITKFKTSTIAETEMVALAGARDVLLAFPPTRPTAIRLAELIRRFAHVRFSTIVDHPVSVELLATVAQAEAVQFEVFVDLNVGMQRTGIAPGEAAPLYRSIAAQPALRAAGLHAYDGHLTDPEQTTRFAQAEAAFAPVLALRRELEATGLPVPALIAGGSPTFTYHAGFADRELSPGTTVLWDFGYGDKFPELPFLPAAVLLTRVVSQPAPHRLCLDLGHKAVAAENPHPRVRLLELPEAEFVMQSEEHLVIETPRAGQFSPGEILHGIPRHVCPTVALYHEATVIAGGQISAVWPIAARARRLSV